MYDAIVVGARCAGAPTAMLLARQGHRVLLVDRATFPSDTISTHGVSHRGLVKLKEWGLYDRIRATNCPEVIRRTVDIGDFPLTGDVDKRGGLPSLICPRRTVLDTLLVDAAAAAGAEVREGFAVREVLAEDGRVTGIAGAAGGGPVYTERATVVIGADGKHSLVARAVGSPTYKEVPPLMCWYYSYWTDLQDNPHGFGGYTRDRRKCLSIPTNDGLTCLLVGWPHEDFPRVRADLEREYHAAVRTVSPMLADLLPASRRVERYIGMADLPNFFRKPSGRGWALVGDAGYHKDPVAAHGIADAFRDAGLLAEAVHAGLAGDQPMDEALAGYEQQRNADAFPRYEQNCRSASFEPPPDDELRLRAALRGGDQSDIDLYLSARSSIVPREAFFNPENLARIFAAARPPHAAREASRALPILAPGHRG
jgi:2-polyprenyl-6-methoxyphenol hydroxylase-like FAD-dependent oxidoreductase